MLLTCKCLNVSITIKGSEINPIELDKFGLSNLELHDAFFKDTVGTVELGEINKEQACLVHIRHVGDWLVHRCLNCDMHTHAIHRDRRGECVIVNQSLLADAEQIAVLKSSDAFSEVFRIITNHDEVMSSDISVSKVTGSMQSGAVALQQQLADAIKHQTSQVEEKIRAFSEQQYTELENFRKTAHDDQRALLKLLQRWSEVLQKEEHPPTVVTARPPTAPMKLESVPSLSTLRPASLAKQGPPAKSKKSQPSSVPGSQYSPFDRVSSACSQPRGRQSRARRELGAQGSLDTEGLFDLEGMDEAGQDLEHFHSEDETDDTDESGSHDEGIHIPRHRSASQLAKSLPVNVPAFHLATSVGSAVMVPQDYDAKEYAEERMDIAASIKALAQSVHGGASVFGDLPRPRFSTQL